ncbi:hypothetical protein HPB49_026552 [Dermacentor silvarum]|nr:hypothetical protein HPB49_026552 [Dermacentor silvarum]
MQPHLDGEEGNDERYDIGEHVERVGHQGHRVGDIANDDLDQEEGRRHAKHEQQPAPAPKPHPVAAAPHLLAAVHCMLPAGREHHLQQLGQLSLCAAFMP